MFENEDGFRLFLHTLDEACLQTGWSIPAAAIDLLPTLCKFCGVEFDDLETAEEGNIRAARVLGRKNRLF